MSENELKSRKEELREELIEPTQTAVEVIALFDQGLSVPEIKERTGLSDSSVRPRVKVHRMDQYADRLVERGYEDPRENEIRRAAIAEYEDEPGTIDEITERMDIETSKTTVYLALHSVYREELTRKASNLRSNAVNGHLDELHGYPIDSPKRYMTMGYVTDLSRIHFSSWLIRSSGVDRRDLELTGVEVYGDPATGMFWFELSDAEDSPDFRTLNEYGDGKSRYVCCGAVVEASRQTAQRESPFRVRAWFDPDIGENGAFVTESDVIEKNDAD